MILGVIFSIVRISMARFIDEGHNVDFDRIVIGDVLRDFVRS